MVKIVKDNFTSIKQYLEGKRQDIEKRMASLRSEDPFEDSSRLNDNAASDTEAREEEGHERITALNTELEATLKRIKQALARIGIGKYGICERCKKSIDSARLKIFPMAEYCLTC